MRPSLALLFIFFLSPPTFAKELVLKWETEHHFRTDESVYYDAKRDIIYVSNFNERNMEKADGDGFISRLKTDGTIENLMWVRGLNDPRGMGIKGNSLFVADRTELVEIDIQRGQIIAWHPAPGSVMLNDVFVNDNGLVFVSDSRGDKIYQLSGNKMSVWISDPDLKSPNGLWWDKRGLLVLSTTTGNLFSIDPWSKKRRVVATIAENADGIQPVGGGDYIVSCWTGEIYYVSSIGIVTKLLDTKEQEIYSADIGYIQKLNLLLVPTLQHNSVMAYSLQ